MAPTFHEMLEKLRDLKNELVLAPHFWRLGLINISFSLDRFVPSVMLLEEEEAAVLDNN